MSKISDLSDGGSLTSTDFLVAVRSGGNVKVQADGAVTGTTITGSGDMNIDSGTLFVDASANAVGIGTSSPSAKLHVASGGSPADLELKFDTGAGATSSNFVDFNHSRASGNFTFSFAGTERMRIDSSGRVGIGTTPSNKLHVGSASDAATNMSSSADGILRLTGASYSFAIANNDTGTFIYNNGSSRAMVFGTNETERMRIDTLGNLKIGTTSITTDNGIQLYKTGQIYTHVDGTNATDHVRFYRNNTQVGDIRTSGTATSYNSGSDARLKENISDAEDAGATVDAIQVRQFDWKADGSHQRFGMVAQELLEVAPEAVSGDPESDDMMGVDYSKLVPMLVKEIQSLRARVAQLEGA